jgi:hypothetical protein
MPKTVTVDAGDLKAVLSLLRVYMGSEEPAGHFKDIPGQRLPDAFFFVRIGNLEKALNDINE